MRFAVVKGMRGWRECSNTYCTYARFRFSRGDSSFLLFFFLPFTSLLIIHWEYGSLSLLRSLDSPPTYPVNKLRSRTYFRFPRHCLHGVQLHVRRARMRRMLLSPRWTAELLSRISRETVPKGSREKPGRHRIFAITVENRNQFISLPIREA